MAICVAAATLPRVFPFLVNSFSTKNSKATTHRRLHCSRDGKSDKLSGMHVQAEFGVVDNVEVEEHQSRLNTLEDETDEKQSDLWQLFKEAKQNIMYLNKQRLLAMAEVDKLKKERDSLLDRVNQLDAKKPEFYRRDKLQASSAMLLRIDSMVLSGLIGISEAADLRRIIIDSLSSVADDLLAISDKNADEFLAELRNFSKHRKLKGYHIIHICTEMSPLVSVGCLASYITGLSCALQRRGNLVEVILPKYSCLNLNEVQGLQEVEAELYSYFNGQLHMNRIWTGVLYGIAVTFIEPVYYSSFFRQERVYGLPNDFERFSYFSRASLDYLVKSGKRPDVIHIHNWQTSIVGPLFWDAFVNQGFECTRILLTCHGFDAQGLEQPEKLELCGLDPLRLNRPDRLQDNNKNHLVNILKGGIVYSNKVIILSSIQPRGLFISALGHGLEPSLTIHKDKLMVAPYGYDRSTWDPSCDKHIPRNYTIGDMAGKSACKVSLQRRLGLPDEESSILVGCIYSKIVDVVTENVKALVWMASKKEVQFVFMGPSSKTVAGFLQEELNATNLRFIDEYDEESTRHLLAGCDIMLCPSFDDPHFQVPLKALRYGTAPIPLHFAGSKFGYFGEDNFESTSFAKYINYSFSNLSLSQAIDEIKDNASQWHIRIRDAMRKDFSWDSECADVHISAYEDIKTL